MSENSKIEWTDSTWNFLVGCDKVSAGCKNCYAIQTSWIRQHNPKMQGKFAGVVEKTAAGNLNWTGMVNISFEALLIPLKKKKHTKYFVNSLSDLFHENVPFQVIDKAFAVMAIAMQHTFQILTKRPQRMVEYFSRPDLVDCIATIIADMAQRPPVDYETAAVASQALFEDGFPLPNVHIGVSCEDQKTADERIPFLIKTPAAVRFLSCEPLIGPLDISSWFYPKDMVGTETSNYEETEVSILKQDIHWVIVGGESGKGSRPMHPDWARSLRDQCQTAGVSYFFKQWGEWYTGKILITTGEPTFQMYRSYEHFAAKDWVNKGDVCISIDGRICKIGKDFMDCAYPVAIMQKVGKKKAGRELDGRTWDEMPYPSL